MRICALLAVSAASVVGGTTTDTDTLANLLKRADTAFTARPNLSFGPLSQFPLDCQIEGFSDLRSLADSLVTKSEFIFDGVKLSSCPGSDSLANTVKLLSHISDCLFFELNSPTVFSHAEKIQLGADFLEADALMTEFSKLLVVGVGSTKNVNKAIDRSSNAIQSYSKDSSDANANLQLSYVHLKFAQSDKDSYCESFDALEAKCADLLERVSSRWKTPLFLT